MRYSSALRYVKPVIDAALYGKPSGSMSIGDYARRYPDLWRLVVAAQDGERPEPISLGRQRADLRALLDPIPPLGVIALPHGAIFGSQGWVFTSQGRLITDTSWFGQHFRDADLPKVFGKARVLNGVCLTLSSDFAWANFGHFILDCLPRFGLLQAAGYTLADVDYIYIPRPPTTSAAFIMEAIGIPESKCIWSQRDTFLRADVVLATSFPGTRRNYSRFVPQFFRTPVASVAPTGRRVYIPRGGQRKVRNEPELLRIASEFEVDLYDFKAYQNEPAFFAGVDAVIGAHGSGMTNLAFCRPGTRVLELIPSDHVYPYYFTLADSAGLEYRYLVGTSIGSRPKDAWGPSPFDFEVDPDEFRQTLQAQLG